MDNEAPSQSSNREEPKLRVRGRILTLTVGLPASGKTTWALSAGFDHAVSLDDCREALWRDPAIQNGPGGFEALVSLQDKWIDDAMVKDQSIVVHNTNLLYAHRRPLVEKAKKTGYASQIVYFDVSKDECLHRNRRRERRVPDEVIEDFARRMEVPEPDEADLVISISDPRF